MIRKQNTPAVILLTVILFLVFIVSPEKLVGVKNGVLFFLRAPLSVGYRVYRTIINTGSLFTSYRDLSRMRSEREQLQFVRNELTEVKLENQRLRALLGFKEEAPFAFTVAQVIAKEPTNWLNSVVINKGSSDGLFVNQPVMNFSGLIGKIVEIGPATAKVLLISDPNSRVVVMIQRTREEGMLEGVGQGLCRIKYLPVDADVALGDVVVSAGVGGVYPKGQMIGTVESIKTERGGIYKSCIVKPYVALSGIEEVLCLELSLKPEGS